MCFGDTTLGCVGWVLCVGSWELMMKAISGIGNVIILEFGGALGGIHYGFGLAKFITPTGRPLAVCGAALLANRRVLTRSYCDK